MKGTICLDLDGVVHNYKRWTGATNIPGEPVDGAIEFMLMLLNAGYDVAIHSSRSRYFFGPWAMRRWLRDHAGAAWHDSPAGKGLEWVRFPRTKPPALYGLDDRVERFDGTFPTLEHIKNFRPWNKRA